MYLVIWLLNEIIKIMKYCLDTIVLNSRIKKPDSAVIFCHGYGGNNKTVAIFAKNWAKYLTNTLIFCPQGKEKDFSKKGYQWFDPIEVSKDNVTSKILEAEFLLNKYINEIIEKNFVEENKIILGGFSQGCMISLQTAIKRSTKINSIIGYSGKIIDFKYLKKNINSKPRVFLLHGSQDEVINLQYHYQTSTFLKKEGFNVETKVFQNCDHKITNIAANIGLKKIKEYLAI
jgi:phospholipase/carboxylesterase